MRVESWPEILAEELRAAQQRPFSFGGHDCCAFCARVVAAMTGRNFLLDFQHYDSEESALEIMAVHGGVRGIATRCLGEPIAVNYAQRGDVVMLQDEGAGEALGICVGVNAAFAAPRGLVLRPVNDCVSAWRV